MIKALRKTFFSFLDGAKESVLVLRLWLKSLRKRPTRPQIKLVVSMTSYPARISKAWIAIETILQQSVRPEVFVLVLAEQEFPGRKLPGILRRQEKRGVQILWTKENGKSYDKLVPVLGYFPDFPIVTVDDDKHFPPNLLRRLWQNHLSFPSSIIGARGWKIRKNRNGLVRFGEGWERVETLTIGGPLHLPGGNGTLYPPGSLEEGVTLLDKALEICPTTDDIWFWAHSVNQGTSLICLGLSPYRPVRALRKSPALSDVNKEQEQSQFARVISYLNLARWIEQEID